MDRPRARHKTVTCHRTLHKRHHLAPAIRVARSSPAGMTAKNTRPEKVAGYGANRFAMPVIAVLPQSCLKLGPITDTDHDNWQMWLRRCGRCIVQFVFDKTTISVNVPHAAALLGRVREKLADRRGFALATLNLDHLVKLHRSPEFRQAYAAQDMVCADGNPIVWLSRLAGRPVDLVPGSTMVVPLCRIAAQCGAKVALFGSTPAALEAAAIRLRQEVPGLIVSHQIAPPMGFDVQGEEAAHQLIQMEQDGVGLCLLALGAPKQEMLAARGRKLAPGVGFASVGAGLDFLAGTQNRAPEWVQKIAMEWAWRMLSQPRRLVPRYLACASLLPSELLRALAQRR